MNLIFFSKCSKFNADFRDATKKWERAFRFLYNWVSLGCHNFSCLSREYSAVHVLKNSRKIYNVTQRDFFQLYWFRLFFLQYWWHNLMKVLPFTFQLCFICVLCLCRIINLNIRNLYQIIDLVVWFLH